MRGYKKNCGIKDISSLESCFVSTRLNRSVKCLPSLSCSLNWLQLLFQVKVETQSSLVFLHKGATDGFIRITEWRLSFLFTYLFPISAAQGSGVSSNSLTSEWPKSPETKQRANRKTNTTWVNSPPILIQYQLPPESESGWSKCNGFLVGNERTAETWFWLLMRWCPPVVHLGWFNSVCWVYLFFIWIVYYHYYYYYHVKRVLVHSNLAPCSTMSPVFLFLFF